MIKVGLIGAGGVVQTLHAPILRQFKDVSIEWVCDVRIDAARKLASAYGVSSAFDDVALCSDVDAVLIAIPVGARETAWRVAAERRWHVLCEKPAARTRAELDHVLGAMGDRVVQFGLMRRFYGGVMCLRDLIGRRIFGDPLEVWAGEGGAQSRTGRGADWYQLDSRLAGGGILIETGAHLLDQVLFVTSAVSCEVEDYKHRIWKSEPEFDARLRGLLTVDRGRKVPFSCAISRSSDLCNGLFLRYPSVVLALPPGPGSFPELRSPDQRLVARLDGVSGGATDSFQAFHEEWRHFLGRCSSKDPAAPLKDNAGVRMSVGLIEDCYEIQRSRVVATGPRSAS